MPPSRPPKQRPLSSVLLLGLTVTLLLVTAILVFQTYRYARQAIDTQMEQRLTQSHHTLQLAMNHRLNHLAQRLDSLASRLALSYGQDGWQRPLALEEESQDLDFLFIAQDKTLYWQNAATDFFVPAGSLPSLIDPVGQGHHWYLAILPRDSALPLVLLLRHVPLVAPHSGQVLASLYGALVLSDNLELLQGLRRESQLQALSLEYRGEPLLSTLPPGTSLAASLAKLPVREGLQPLGEHLLASRQALSLDDQASALTLVAVAENRATPRLQEQYLHGTGIVLLLILAASWMLLLHLHQYTLLPLRRLVKWSREVSADEEPPPFVPGSIAEYNELGQALSLMVQRQKEKEHYFQDLLEFAFSPIIVWNARLQVQQCNAAASRLIGLSAQPGEPVFKLFPDEARNTLESSAQGQVCAGVELQYPNGRLLIWNMAPVRIGDKVTAVIAQGLDVTALKQAQRESLLARQAAEAATRTKSEFLATVTHEIRTPLNGILGMAHLLQDGPLTATAREYAQTITESGQALLTIINDILDFSKIEADKLILSPEPFHLPRLLQGVIRQLAPLAEQKAGLQLELQMAPDLPENLVGDAGRLRQILINLIGNGIKFTERGQVRLRARLLARQADKVQLELTVSDSGIGIPPEAQRNLFQAFQQADASTTRHYGGTGLGLAICRRLLDMMDGSIQLSSRQGVGSSFTVQVPLLLASQPLPAQAPTPALVGPLPQAPAEDLPPPNSPAAPPAAEEPLPDLGDPHVLLVEDNRVNQQVALLMLKKLGCRVSLAQNGEVALQKTLSESFDVILMDCQMPVLNGYDATRRIRLSQPLQGRRLPIIAMTANDLPQERAKCQAAGMDDFLAKPFRREELARRLAHWLQRD
ncbi:ATP-binding protein [Pseudaeromonas sp. ZJS20]|uniref:ATP-binding protein n=1 Tax=Pseudaeromonas aegiceratis TaxID=3153928 RepID=UPI00390C7ADE